MQWPAGVEPTAEFAAAIEAARNVGDNLFVTGRAGTGKSTLLRCLKSNLPQKTAVLAPGGLAAVNVHGQTVIRRFKVMAAMPLAADRPERAASPGLPFRQA